MVIERIKELLLQDGTVTVPDLGTFKAEASGASFDEDGAVLIPPSVKFSFTENIEYKRFDVLADYIVKKDGLRKELANDAIREFVGGIKEDIGIGNRSNLEGIGALQRGMYDSLEFLPETGDDALPYSYGLSSVEAEPLLDEEPNSDEPEITSHSNEKVAGKKKELTLWLILIPIVLLIAFGAYFYFNTDARTKISAVLFGSSQSDSTAVVLDSAQLAQQKYVQDSLNLIKEEEAKRLANEADKKNQPVVAQKTGIYYLVVGSMTAKENADKMLADCKAKGYSTAKIIASDGKYRVSVADFKNKYTANNSMNKYRADYPNVWLFVY